MFCIIDTRVIAENKIYLDICYGQGWMTLFKSPGKYSLPEKCLYVGTVVPVKWTGEKQKYIFCTMYLSSQWNILIIKVVIDFEMVIKIDHFSIGNWKCSV